MDPKVLWSIIIVGLIVGLVAFLGMDGPNKIKGKIGKKS